MRKVKALGLETPSIDYGQSTDFIVHRIINGADKPGFENVANVDRMPAAGATIIALPIKIEGGSGGPARIIAVRPLYAERRPFGTAGLRLGAQ